MEKPKTNVGFLSSPWFYLLFLFSLGNPASSQPFLRLGQRLMDIPTPSAAMESSGGMEKTVNMEPISATKGSLQQHYELQEHLHTQPTFEFCTTPAPSTEASEGSVDTKESVLMEVDMGSVSPMSKPVPLQHRHQHLHAQTLPKSLVTEQAVATEGSLMTAKDMPHPQTFFEVSSPLDPPPHTPCASLHIFKHSFANTLTRPPAMANYTPPPSHACKNTSLIVLKWSGSSIGRQFDRIAAVWFGGVELLRTCTAEPSKQGIYWEVKKDVTKYATLLAEPQPIVVELGNLVDKTYTGIFHINLTLDFFSTSHVKHGKTHEMPADLILAVSSPSPLPSGHWFQIPNDSYIGQKSFSVPANVYKAVLEIYVSFHGSDEFWYTNPPNEYVSSNNLSGVPGNGAFREVQAFLDGQLVAAVWPFPVVYTGGIVNLCWRPAAAIGAFNLPSYEFDLSPFVGLLTDGREHTLGFRVENAIGNWLIDGCLHLWLDQNSAHISGNLVSYMAPAYTITLSSHFQGLNGTFHTTASRVFSYSGYVVSSLGNLSVSSSYALEYNNVLVFANNSATQTVSQTIHSKGEIKTETPSEVVLFQESSHAFPLNLLCFNYEGANSSMVVNCNFSHAFNERISTFSDSGNSSLSLLNNSQQCEGGIVIANNLVVAGLGALQQQYSSEGSHGCYKRILGTKNSTILSDAISLSCSAIIN